MEIDEYEHLREIAYIKAEKAIQEWQEWEDYQNKKQAIIKVEDKKQLNLFEKVYVRNKP